MKTKLQRALLALILAFMLFLAPLVTTSSQAQVAPFPLYGDEVVLMNRILVKSQEAINAGDYAKLKLLVDSYVELRDAQK